MTVNLQGSESIIGSKSFTAVAINCAAKAGEWIKSKLGAHASLSLKSSPHDLVTEVDKGSEKMIRSLILTHFPHHSFLGEEGAGAGPEASRQALEAALQAEDYLWIVDPIDGTTNFVHGFPGYVVSIALAYRGEVIVGVIYDPSRDEMFVAEKGKGAYVHGKRMQVDEADKLGASLIATGFPADHLGSLPVNLRGIQAVAPRVRNVRVAGSAALHLAYVAAGRLSGFWEIGLSSWDVAAGVLMVQESGGRVSDTSGAAYDLRVRNIAATNGAVHEELLHTLQAAGAAGGK
ncbi:inositol monophosphatase [Paenibacillus sp. IB182496]|uniref:Inositol-1-monophosphatase n=1 Tax=Paenibacillus sabuli TaxID=2772509 RepID=A0A927BWW4_9BACL|nr:inositol monophosphatase family protein [Paenibacillus sabuli]MBD2848352.1 inositol monophosphatase [Paenibacillus sabuli]